MIAYSHETELFIGYLLLLMVALGFIVATYFILSYIVSFCSWVWHDIIKKKGGQNNG